MNTLSKATLSRLPSYLKYLRELSDIGSTRVSATAIATALSLGEIQVRKDLASVSSRGRPKIGYTVSELIEDIEAKLGLGQMTDAVLVGAGKLGRALLDYDGFEEYGVRIVAAFDSNDRVIRMNKTEKDILPFSMLDEYCKSKSIRLGIITTGSGSAQEVLDRLCECGVTAVLNFAPCKLTVPRGVVVKNENLALSLAHLNEQICN